MKTFWGLLVKEVYKDNQVFNNIEDLINQIQSSWMKFDQKILQQLIDSMEDRLIDVIKVDGDYTHY